MSPVRAHVDLVQRRLLGIWARTGVVGKVIAATAKDAVRDRIGSWAAAIAFYALLSIFPLLLGGIAAASYVVDRAWAIEQAVALTHDLLPTQDALVRSTIEEAFDARGGLGLLSLLALLWSGGRVFATLTIALNVAYGVEDTYGPLKRAFVRLAMVLSVGLLSATAVVSGLTLDAVAERLPWLGGIFARAAGYVGTTALLGVAFFSIYRFVPRRRIANRAAAIGAATAAFLFAVARPGFVYWTTHVAEQNVVYGSLAAVAIAMLWMWIASIIVLLGGELATHVDAIAIGREAPTE
jgi:membrane protein